MEKSKFTVSLVITGATCFALGHYYALVSDSSGAAIPQKQTAEVERNIQETNWSADTTEVQATTTPPNEKVTIENYGKEEYALLDEPDAIMSSLPTIDTQSATELSTQYGGDDFNQWQASSKSHVKLEMEKVLPESIRDSFLKKVGTAEYFSDIPSLSEQQLASLSVDMETHIRDFISLHQFGNQTEIFDLKCMQLNCRIFGRATDPVKWQQMYVELIFSFSSIGLVQNENNVKKGVTFVDTDSNEAFFYNQLSMKPL